MHTVHKGKNNSGAIWLTSLAWYGSYEAPIHPASYPDVLNMEKCVFR